MRPRIAAAPGASPIAAAESAAQRSDDGEVVGATDRSSARGDEPPRVQTSRGAPARSAASAAFASQLFGARSTSFDASR